MVRSPMVRSQWSVVRGPFSLARRGIGYGPLTTDHGLLTTDYFHILDSRALYLERPEFNARLKRNDKVKRFGVESHLHIRRRRVRRGARVRVIDPKQSLAGFAYAPHRREQLFGRREIPGLRFVGVVPKLMNIGNQAVTTAEQAAAFRRVLTPRVLFYRCNDRVCDLNEPGAQSVCLSDTFMARDSIMCARQKMKPQSLEFSLMVYDIGLRI